MAAKKKTKSKSYAPKIEKALVAASKAVAKAIKARNKIGKKELKAAFKAYFDAFPEVKAITWVQYTPYFNDGDACTFSLNEPALAFVDEIPEGIDTCQDGYYDPTNDTNLDDLLTEGVRHYNRETGEFEKERDATDEEKAFIEMAREPIAELDKFWEQVADSDLFEHVFGDHIRVIATRKGFTEEEHSHD